MQVCRVVLARVISSPPPPDRREPGPDPRCRRLLALVVAAARGLVRRRLSVLRLRVERAADRRTRDVVVRRAALLDAAALAERLPARVEHLGRELVKLERQSELLDRVRAEVVEPERRRDARLAVAAQPRGHALRDDDLAAKAGVADLAREELGRANVQRLARDRVHLRHLLPLGVHVCVVDAHAHAQAAEDRLGLEPDRPLGLRRRHEPVELVRPLGVQQLELHLERVARSVLDRVERELERVPDRRDLVAAELGQARAHEVVVELLRRVDDVRWRGRPQRARGLNVRDDEYWLRGGRRFGHPGKVRIVPPGRAQVCPLGRVAHVHRDDRREDAEAALLAAAHHERLRGAKEVVEHRRDAHDVVRHRVDLVRAHREQADLEHAVRQREDDAHDEHALNALVERRAREHAVDVLVLAPGRAQHTERAGREEHRRDDRRELRDAHEPVRPVVPLLRNHDRQAREQERG
ncbi:hypothetical protein PybrP1_009370 [[Pythium] brassicae (nom. inval.)]|nr:hypothetical protein PybrP1_009370 [[Pythium] brassicae (nom. inval.)]